ncbi:phosphatases II [Testicularia cyperi]|uniref:protein-tyrosine-phosphatase n=1 Tax=Testicularia cyperi TaxID=1882483 RepID=A0A317XPC5_9BASI|nr:phosphatases II [Testicularia cyperi]
MDPSSSPPPTPGPSSFAPPSVHPAHHSPSASSSRDAHRMLSLQIPQDSLAFGGLSQPSPSGSYSRLSPSAHVRPCPIVNVNEPCPSPLAGPSSLRLPPPSRLARKRPSKLTLAPPSLSDDQGLSSRSMPSSPVVVSRSHSQIGAESSDKRASLSEAVKNLSSTLRGTPRRRPSMPFKTAAATNHHSNDADLSEPPTASSIRSRPPEVYRDPSEHILSGKGSTLQHARSVYSHGPVEILPGLFLGDEHNARDSQMLSDLGITTILNVAKETVLPFTLDRSSISGGNNGVNSRSSGSTNNASAPSCSSGPVYQHWPKSAARPSSAHRQASLDREALERYFTPPTTALPSTAEPQRHGPPDDPDSPMDAVSTALLRNTSSTPNLLTQFLSEKSAPSSGRDSTSGGIGSLRTLTSQDVLRYRSLRRQSSSSSDDAFDTASSPSSSHAPSTCTSATTELTPPAAIGLQGQDDLSATALINKQSSASSSNPASRHVSPGFAFDPTSQRRRSSADLLRAPWVTQVELPANATAIKVPASPASSRSSELRYIKLPWTHDETDLAIPDGGFTQGCALIAEALGIDARLWTASKIANDVSAYSLLTDETGDIGTVLQRIRPSHHNGKVLVHCQCGVSRSATLVIAFVMQAAAMRYGYAESSALMGMHDCYNMVKDKSASISPNISLIYQLVEWERHLSSAAGRLRDVLGDSNCTDEAGGAVAANGGGSGGGRPGWSTETMDEAMWSKMRLEEEEKEAAEEARRRDERLAEAKRLALERKAAEDRLEGRRHSPPADVGGETSMGSLMQRRRKKAAPALQLQTASSNAASHSTSASSMPPSRLNLGPPAPSASAAGAISPGVVGKRRPPALQLSSRGTAVASGGQLPAEPETPFQTARMQMWPEPDDAGIARSAHDTPADAHDTDVTMEDYCEPPMTPFRSCATELDPVSTPTASKASDLSPTSVESTLRTPCARSIAAPAAALMSDRLADRPRPSSMSRLAGRPNATLASSMPASATHLPMGSAAMSPSLSVGPGMPSHRFSFGGAAAVLSSSSSSGSRQRPDSMQSTMSSAASSTALFGVTALSREERKKQHRRTFSSDWPALQADFTMPDLE